MKNLKNDSRAGKTLGVNGKTPSVEEARVLFLSLSGIGNLLIQLPTIEALKKARPNWHITVWVVPRGTKAIAESQSYIDDVIEMPISVSPPARGGVRGDGSIAWQHVKNIIALRKSRFDIGIVLSPGQLMKSAAYLKLAGIPVRIGNSYPYKGSPHASNFLTHIVDEQENLHDIEQNLRLLEPLGIHPNLVPYYSLQIPQENIEEAGSFPLLTKEGLGEVSYVGIHAGCAKGFEFKRWPLERFAEVAKALLQKNSNTRFVVFGGPDEEDQKQELVGMIIESSSPTGKTLGVNDETPSVEEVGYAQAITTSLLTTAAIMQHCKLLISNDSGLMHIAAAVGTPTIGIFGPTDEALTGPRGPKGFIVRADGTKPVYTTENKISLGSSAHPSLLAIKPQMVLDKISL